MKGSTAAALALVALLLSHTDPVQGSSLALTQHSRDHHIPMQVKLRSDMRGWKAPVIDKTSQQAPVEQQKSPLADKVQYQAPRTNKDFVERNRSNGDDSIDEPSANTVNSEDNRQHVRVSIKNRYKSNERSHKEDKDGDDAGLATELQLQNEKETMRDDGTGDLYEVAPGSMTNHQYYSASQVEAEAQKVSAAMKLQMAKTAPLDGDSSSSVVFAVAVAGLVVAVIGIVAVVALARQYSEFPEVELESDLPSDLEAGRVEDDTAEATAAVQSTTVEEDAAVVDASELSTYILSDVEEDETKEGDEDDDDE